MRSMIFIALATAASLSACGESSEPTEDAEATAITGAEVDPNNPFSQAEAEMNQRMMQAVGANVSDTWLKQIIEHHRGAIEMSEIMLAQNPSEHARHIAEDTIRKQTAEIEKLRALVSGAPADPTSLEPYRPVHERMRADMRAAVGGSPSETFMRKMLAHHQGGVALSDVVLDQGQNARVRQQAQQTRASQQEDAKMVEDMLAGRPMSSSSTPASQPAASAAQTSQAAPTSRSTSSAAAPGASTPARSSGTPEPVPAAPEADPHAGHDMTGGQ